MRETTPMELAEHWVQVLDEFLAYAKDSRRRSPNTVKAYQVDLLDLFQDLQSFGVENLAD